MKKILLHAYGNPGRGDDGLGNELIEEIERWIAETNIRCVDTDSSYQLNIEDASTIATYDVVIFIDASKAEIESYCFAQIQPKETRAFTTHAVSPSCLLALCEALFDHPPAAYLLQIKGYCWKFGEGLSPRAKENLDAASRFLRSTVTTLQNREG